MSLKLTSKNGILLIIVLAQFLCTSLWFAGNAVVEDLILQLDFPQNSVSNLTSSIQFGFIIGTLAYALLSIADRFSPSKVFFVSALLASLCNLLLLLPIANYGIALLSRFATGFFLAGIYPVGMKIAADHFDKDLGKSLGLLVGALVVGTAFPHFVRSYFAALSYTYVLLSVSLLALLGGSLIFLLVPDGPYRKASQKVLLGSTFKVFKKPEFRGAAFGYFGHMWELYTFYAFLPAILLFASQKSMIELKVSLWSFLIIAIGGLGCALTGFFSQIYSAKSMATASLASSAMICLLSPWVFGLSMPILLGVLLFWGMTVSADSPMFSTLVAKHAIPDLKGSALTIVNCIGFALTIVSIQLLTFLEKFIAFQYLFLVLAVGPLIGLWSLWRK